jgi:hypothetical protein
MSAGEQSGTRIRVANRHHRKMVTSTLPSLSGGDIRTRRVGKVSEWVMRHWVRDNTKYIWLGNHNIEEK